MSSEFLGGQRLFSLESNEHLQYDKWKARKDQEEQAPLRKKEEQPEKVRSKRKARQGKASETLVAEYMVKMRAPTEMKRRNTNFGYAATTKQGMSLAEQAGVVIDETLFEEEEEDEGSDAEDRDVDQEQKSKMRAEWQEQREEMELQERLERQWEQYQTHKEKHPRKHRAKHFSDFRKHAFILSAEYQAEKDARMQAELEHDRELRRDPRARAHVLSASTADKGVRLKSADINPVDNPDEYMRVRNLEIAAEAEQLEKLAYVRACERELRRVREEGGASREDQDLQQLREQEEQSDDSASNEQPFMRTESQVDPLGVDEGQDEEVHVSAAETSRVRRREQLDAKKRALQDNFERQLVDQQRRKEEHDEHVHDQERKLEIVRKRKAVEKHRADAARRKLAAQKRKARQDAQREAQIAQEHAERKRVKKARALKAERRLAAAREKVAARRHRAKARAAKTATSGKINAKTRKGVTSPSSSSAAASTFTLSAHRPGKVIADPDESEGELQHYMHSVQSEFEQYYAHHTGEEAPAPEQHVVAISKYAIPHVLLPSKSHHDQARLDELVEQDRALRRQEKQERADAAAMDKANGSAKSTPKQRVVGADAAGIAMDNPYESEEYQQRVQAELMVRRKEALLRAHKQDRLLRAAINRRKMRVNEGQVSVEDVENAEAEAIRRKELAVELAQERRAARDAEQRAIEEAANAEPEYIDTDEEYGDVRLPADLLDSSALGGLVRQFEDEENSSEEEENKKKEHAAQQEAKVEREARRKAAVETEEKRQKVREEEGQRAKDITARNRARKERTAEHERMLEVLTKRKRAEKQKAEADRRKEVARRTAVKRVRDLEAARVAKEKALAMQLRLAAHKEERRLEAARAKVKQQRDEVRAPKKQAVPEHLQAVRKPRSRPASAKPAASRKMQLHLGNADKRKSKAGDTEVDGVENAFKKHLEAEFAAYQQGMGDRLDEKAGDAHHLSSVQLREQHEALVEEKRVEFMTAYRRDKQNIAKEERELCDLMRLKRLQALKELDVIRERLGKERLMEKAQLEELNKQRALADREARKRREQQ
jgi:hypothetical protein